MPTLANKRKEYLDKTYDEDLEPLEEPVKKGGLLTKVRKNVPIAVDAIKGWANRVEGRPMWAPAYAMHGVAPHDQWDREAYEKWLDQGGVMDDGSDPPPYEEYWKKKMDNKDGPGLDPADPRYSYRTLSMGDGVVRPNAETKALSEKLQQEELDKRGRKSALDPLRSYFTSED